MDKLLIVVGIVAFYFALQLWILPAFGVPTWMSGKCSPGEGKKTADENDTAEKQEVTDKGLDGEKSEN